MSASGSPIFYMIALTTWAFMLTAYYYYYGYRAMHNHNERIESEKPVTQPVT